MDMTAERKSNILIKIYEREEKAWRRGMKKIRFAWHCHHNRLMEPLTEPISVRRKFIRENKPKEEVPLRLRLLKEVKGKLPREVIRTGEAYFKAWEAYNKEYRKHYKEIQALHKKECGCG